MILPTYFCILSDLSVRSEYKDSLPDWVMVAVIQLNTLRSCSTFVDQNSNPWLVTIMTVPAIADARDGGLNCSILSV